jgi:lantibiotic modifying enzyme
MFDPNRHFPLKNFRWEPELVQETIQEIAQDATTRLDRSQKLPRHPLDDFGVGSDLYMGTTGVIWALTYLDRMQAVRARADFTALLQDQLLANEKDSSRMPHPENASYLFGDLPIFMLQFRLAPDTRITDRLFESIRKNNVQPVREFMWGAAGSMLCANFLYGWTSEDRWKELYLFQAERLLSERERIDGVGYLWTVDLYGQKQKFLGPVHGFAGNIIPFIKGRDLLPKTVYEDVCSKAVETLVNTAITDDTHANWVAVFDEFDRTQNPHLVQHCHGAPGMVTVFSDFASGIDRRFDRLMEKAGELIWDVGPLQKGANLCHGTAGNGYALLKLCRRTRNDLWLERARAFAMNAIGQYRAAKELYGQGRYTLWTGDLGTAVYLWDCINGEANFPTVDVF